MEKKSRPAVDRPQAWLKHINSCKSAGHLLLWTVDCGAWTSLSHSLITSSGKRFLNLSILFAYVCAGIGYRLPGKNRPGTAHRAKGLDAGKIPSEPDPSDQPARAQRNCGNAARG